MALDGFLVQRSPMSLRLPQPVPPVPDDTARIACAAFPRGNPYLLLRDRLGPVFDDAGFADLYPRRGQPGYTPWRLALVTLLKFREGLVWGHRCQGSSSAAAFLRLGSVGRRLRANPRGARHRARGSSRRNLVSGGPLGARTMMQPCASAAKLRGGGSNLNSGFQANPLFGAPPPRIIHGSSPRGRR